MEDNINIYEIPECNFPNLEAKIEKLNKKAKKLNCQIITINKIGYTDKKVKINDDFNLLRFYQITITGSAPVINNWELIASCEQKEKGTLIRVIPGKTYPEKYRSLMICEHCNSNRYRKYTYIVRNTITNEYKMVGKSCLKDFLGHTNPQFIAQMLQWLTEPELSEYSDISSCSEFRIETKNYLAFVAACIKESGWISKTIANEQNKQSTSNYALKSMRATYKPEYDRFGNIVKYPIPDENDKIIVENALNWAKNLTGNLNDYLYNINLLAQEESIKHKDLGFTASIISSYQKTIENNIKREKQLQQKQLSNYVGNIGEKITKELTYVNSYSYETQYGTTWIHKFIDNNSNTYVWKTNKILEKIIDNTYISINQGETTKIKGTIKDHNEYREEKQTILTRCKII